MKTGFGDLFEGLTRLSDTVLNGRPAQPRVTSPKAVTIEALIARGTSYIRVDGKMYRVEVKKVDMERTDG